MIWDIVAVLSAMLALNAAGLGLWNLTLYRRLPRTVASETKPVSLLIPARNEALRIGLTLSAAMRSLGVAFEVVVLDDNSEDQTAEVVGTFLRDHPNLRLETAPPLPDGWSGKQRACQLLATHARHDILVFLDADVRLAPDALARISAAMSAESGPGLLSGFPKQETRGFLERLVIPMIHFLLLGFLPFIGMRRSASASFAAGCGQLIAVRRDAYDAAGGHAAIRASRHDGIKLPRAFRNAGQQTDLFDATDIASCRMYVSAEEVWLGFKKNANEGMATPLALPIWTLLLFGGQVLPFLLLLALGWIQLSGFATACATAAALAVTGFRLLMAARFGQSLLSALLHPIGVLTVLAIQWSALIDGLIGRTTPWRGRSSVTG